MQAKAGKKRRELQRQVLFTMPIRPKAGKIVRVYYNPDVTPLRGRPETWLRGGYNRCECMPSTWCNYGLGSSALKSHITGCLSCVHVQLLPEVIYIAPPPPLPAKVSFATCCF